MATSGISISSTETGEIKGPFINKRLRSVKWPDLLGARVHAGTIRRSAGVGDVIMADLQKGFFAIADSSDRNPVFGRQFLEHFIAFIEDYTRFSSRVINSKETLPDMLKSIAYESEEILGSLPFHGTCAFTGLCLIRTDKGPHAFLLHTGDTALFMMSPGGDVSLITEKSFWLVGKSSSFYQVEILRIEQGARFLFATDGFYGLTPCSGVKLTSLIEEPLSKQTIEDIPDIIFDSCRIPPSGADDIAVMSLDLSRLFHITTDAEPIILGGTTAYQENKQRIIKNRIELCNS